MSGAGVNFVVLNGGPRLGDMTAGMTAATWGATTSVIASGLVAPLGVGVYAMAVPEIAAYTDPEGVEPSTIDGARPRRGVAFPP